MIHVGLALLGLAGLLGVAFVVATTRADARLHETDPGALTAFEGWPRRWALAATLCGVLSVLLLAGGVFGR